MTDQDKQAILTKWEAHQENSRIEAEEAARLEIEAIEQRERANATLAVLIRIGELVSDSQTTTEMLVLEVMEENHSVPHEMIGALLNIIRNERAARIKAEATLAKVPVQDIARAMADTTAQHYSWYAPISLWLESING